MTNFTFDDSNIDWKRLEGIDHLWLSVLNIDDDAGIVHVLYKFAANAKILLHRHKTLNKTFVIQGEHRLYHANDEIKELLYEILDDAQNVVAPIAVEDFRALL